MGRLCETSRHRAQLSRIQSNCNYNNSNNNKKEPFALITPNNEIKTTEIYHSETVITNRIIEKKNKSINNNQNQIRKHPLQQIDQEQQQQTKQHRHCPHCRHLEKQCSNVIDGRQQPNKQQLPSKISTNHQNDINRSNVVNRSLLFSQQLLPIGNLIIEKLTQFVKFSTNNEIPEKLSTTGSTTTTTASNNHHSHYLVRQSLCLYAASSVLLALCYLTTPIMATDTPHPM